MSFRSLIADFIECCPHINMRKVEYAYLFAKEVHEGQKRRSGEPYIIHPVEVARIVCKAGGDENMIIAALLHDVIEDGKDPEKIGNEIYHQFGGDVFYLVQALSKDGNYKDKEIRDKEAFNQLKKAAETDISVFLIKLADLIHNMGTISALKPAKRDKWIQELKEIYIPFFEDYFHRISFHYHGMYHNLMEELHKIVEAHEVKAGK